MAWSTTIAAMLALVTIAPLAVADDVEPWNSEAFCHVTFNGHCIHHINHTITVSSGGEEQASFYVPSISEAGNETADRLP